MRKMNLIMDDCGTAEVKPDDTRFDPSPVDKAKLIELIRAVKIDHWDPGKSYLMLLVNLLKFIDDPDVTTEVTRVVFKIDRLDSMNNL